MSTPTTTTHALDVAFSTLSTTYTNYIAPHLPPPLASLITTLTSTVSSLVLPILYSGDITSLAALLVILYISVRTLDYVRRTLVGWVVFFGKVALVLGLLQMALYVRAYGWEKALGDAGWIVGLVWGVVEGAWEGAQGNGNGRGRGGAFGGGNVSGRQWGANVGARGGGRWT
jgi:hypothetical protein